MHSFITLTHYNASHEGEIKDLSILWEKGNHTPAKRTIQHLKNTKTESLNSLKMHSVLLLHTITRVTTVEEKASVGRWKRPKRKIQ